MNSAAKGLGVVLELAVLHRDAANSCWSQLRSGIYLQLAMSVIFGEIWAVLPAEYQPRFYFGVLCSMTYMCWLSYCDWRAYRRHMEKFGDMQRVAEIYAEDVRQFAAAQTSGDLTD